jgi:4-diphosphocytidyl-2-C-methyl-D-erythritol kinase
MPPVAMVLVNPGVLVPTGRVFAGLTAYSQRLPRQQLLPHFTLADLVAYLRESDNDLAKPAVEIAPTIREALDALNAQAGCAYAHMSGSGATCFGLFEDTEVSSSATQTIRGEHPDWWVAETRVAAPDIGIPHW